MSTTSKAKLPPRVTESLINRLTAMVTAGKAGRRASPSR